MNKVWAAIRDWIPIEEIRYVFRHVLTYAVVSGGFWICAKFTLAATANFTLLWPEQLKNLQEDAGTVEGFVLIVTLAILGYKLILFMWNTGGSSHNGLVVA
jgi:hypothetical protein